MKSIETKFNIGDDVVHFTGICGKVTAVFHRDTGNTYEFTHLDSEGKIAMINCIECELSKSKNGGIGFNRKAQKVNQF